MPGNKNTWTEEAYKDLVVTLVDHLGPIGDKKKDIVDDMQSKGHDMTFEAFR
jgi:hypothetical protein